MSVLIKIINYLNDNIYNINDKLGKIEEIIFLKKVFDFFFKKMIKLFCRVA